MFQYKPYLHIWQYWSLRRSFPWCSNPNPFYSSIANKKGPWLEVLIFLIRIQHLASACKVGLFQLTWKFILIACCHLMWKNILLVHCHHSSLASDSFRVLSSNLCWTSVKCWHYKLTEYILMVSIKSQCCSLLLACYLGLLWFDPPLCTFILRSIHEGFMYIWSEWEAWLVQHGHCQRESTLLFKLTEVILIWLWGFSGTWILILQDPGGNEGLCICDQCNVEVCTGTMGM